MATLISKTQRQFSVYLQLTDRMYLNQHNRQLTKSILKRHFKLKIELPDDRLCPPVSQVIPLCEARRLLTSQRSLSGKSVDVTSSSLADKIKL
jgi:23S rRNA A1618 N6-methylase RlmF